VKYENKSEKSSIIEGLLIYAFMNTIILFIYIEIIVYLNKMKIVYFLFASVLLFINCRDVCYMLTDKKSDCTDYTLDDEDKEEADSCCFVKAKGSYQGMSGEFKYCELFIKDQVPDLVKKMKKESGVKSYSIDCSSNWLSITLLFVIFALCF
jgi:hypothetical protein